MPPQDFWEVVVVASEEAQASEAVATEEVVAVAADGSLEEVEVTEAVAEEDTEVVVEGGAVEEVEAAEAGAVEEEVDVVEEVVEVIVL